MAKQNRQTVSYLTRRFKEVGLNPNARHGQNFLIDLNLIELLAKSAHLTQDDVVLEIGTGTGSLTALLAAEAAQVITVEIDGHLHQMAREELETFDNIIMLRQDALKNKNHFDPRVLDAIDRGVKAVDGGVLKLVANLPYNVATPIISNLLRCDIVPASMTVTIQKELADRILAQPNSKDYGALSVWIQSLCDVEMVRVMSPGVFWPRPKVESAILHLEHRPDKRASIPNIEFFHQFVRSMFFHRRKFLRSVAISAFKNELTKPEVDEVLSHMELGPDARTEQLDVSQMQQLCQLFRTAVEAKNG
ncbi:MAG: 16S rRNA (adenine(1518)-N(6)/adenine(1519)-N(6))-dimethyltransferase RsmA [Planctomycetota bacterium]|nr:16S rRNA (adenine(1518)-N(6)/adenine(1519)-N(6))-dimethyltransferase RsmA [Planctomycetota bacterium]